MGWTRKRITKTGKERWQACYRDARGQIQTAGTFADEERAEKAWVKAEVGASEGRHADPRRGRQSFRRYATEVWLPNHVMEASTREAYSYQIDRYIIPWFGRMKMAAILPSDVREWVTHLTGLRVKRKNKKGENVEVAALSPATIRNLKNILGAIFTTALNDQVIFLHPCKGVKTPPVSAKPPVIISPEQFDKIHQALGNPDFMLLVELDIESGLRWGELTELRVKDIEVTTRILTVSRAVVQVDPKFHPDGKRFLVKEYPKDKEYRRLKLGTEITDKIRAHIAAKGLRAEDLLFEMPAPAEPVPAREVSEEIASAKRDATLEFVPGTRCRHGLSGYSGAKCRCERCRRAYADYRAERRRNKDKDRPNKKRLRVVDTDGHIPRDWFRVQVWRPALKAA